MFRLSAKQFLASSLSLTGVAIVSAPALAQVTPNPTVINRLGQINLTFADFQEIVCHEVGVDGGYGLGYPDSCNYYTNFPNFYNTAVVSYYRTIACNGTYPQFYRNLLGATSDPYNNVVGRDIYGYVPPTFTETKICTDNLPPFQIPAWFSPKAVSDTTLSILGASTAATPTLSGAGETAGFYLKRTGDLSQAIYVPYTVTGAASEGTDFKLVQSSSANPSPRAGFLYMNPGQSIIPFALLAYRQSPNQPEKRFQITIGLPAGYAPGVSAVFGGVLRAVSVPVVSTTVPQGTSTTLQSGNISQGFTLTRTDSTSTPLSSPLVVPITLGGSAANGQDYSYLPASATIPAGRSSVTVPLSVPQLSGSTAIPAKNITIKVDSTQEFSSDQTQPLNYTIPAYNPQVVTVGTPQGGSTMLTPGQVGSFSFSRSGDTSQPLSVPYSIGGTAQNGSDYGTLPGTATIGAGQSSVTVPISVPVQPRGTSVPAKTIILRPSPSSAYATDPNASPLTLTIPASNATSVDLTPRNQQTTIAPGTTGGFTVSRSGDLSQPLQVVYMTGGSAMNGQDYGNLPGSLTIPVGASSATVPITVPAQNGNTAIPAKTISVQLNPTSDYAPASNTPLAFNIPAYTPTSVSASPTASTTTLPAGSTGGFTITRTGDLSQPLPVTYSIGGSAQNGTDYAQLPGNTTIPAGSASTTIPIVVNPQSGSTAISNKTITIGVSPGQNYSQGSAGTSASPLTYTIPGYTPSAVSFAPNGQGGTIPRGTAGGLVVTRTGDLSQPLPVAYNVGGSATNGTDYNQLPGQVTIPAGQATANIPIQVPAGDGSTQPAKQILITPVAGNGYSPSSTTPVAFNIPATTAPAISFAPGTTGATLAPGQTGGFTVTRSGPTDKAISIPYDLGGTAQNGVDYGQLSGSATIPVGQSSVTVPIIVPSQNGSTASPAKQLTVTPRPGAAYDTSAATPISYTVGGYTPSTVGVAPTSSGSTIAPGQTGGFTLTRTGDLSQPLPVAYTLGGAAQNGVDYSQLSGVATIPAGQSSATVPIIVPSQTGSTAQPTKTLDVTVNPGNGYAPGSATPISYTVGGYTPSSVDLSANGTGTTLTPGTPTNFTVSRSGSTAQPLVVGYDLTGTAQNGTDYASLPGQITIPAGQTSATVPLSVPVQTGSTAQSAKTLGVTVRPGSGYGSGSSAPLSYTIPAYTPSSVSVQPTQGGGTLTPGGSTDGFTVTRSGDTSQPLVVGYNVAGTAQNGGDYGQLPGQITIPAGQTTATVTIRAFPQSGTQAKPAKTIDIALQSGSGYNSSSSTPTTFTIPAYNPPAVGAKPVITVSTPTQAGTTLTPGTSTDAIVVTRSGDTSQPLPIYYTTGGTAKPGQDYNVLPGTVTIAAGKTSAIVPLTLPKDATPGKTVSLDLNPFSGYDPGPNTGVNYTIGSPLVPTAPSSTVGLQVDPLGRPGFVVNRSSGDSTQPLKLLYATTGTAVAGQDYEALPGKVTIPSGANSTFIPVNVLPTSVAGRTLGLNILPSPGYSIGMGNGSMYSIPVNTASTSLSGKKGNSTVAIAGGVAGAGGLVALTSGTLAKAGAAAVGAAGGLLPQACSVTRINPPAGLNTLVDWNKMPADSTATFSGLPAFKADGAVDINKSRRTWSKGQAVADVVRLGDVDGVYNLHCMTMGSIARLGAVDLNKYNLTGLKWFKDTTLKGLSETVYARVGKISEMPGLADHLATNLPGQTKDKLGAMSLREVLKQFPDLGKMEMGQLPLPKIPGFISTVPLNAIPEWQQIPVSRIPGLSKVPFSQFPSNPMKNAQADPFRAPSIR